MENVKPGTPARGARVHNRRILHSDLSRGQLYWLAGPCGSGKGCLAFDVKKAR